MHMHLHVTRVTLLVRVHIHIQFLVPSLHSITIQLEINSLASYWTQHSNTAGVETPVGGSGNTVRLVEPEDCVPVQHALVTFTTGSTGMPKLMLRKHRYNVHACVCMHAHTCMYMYVRDQLNTWPVLKLANRPDGFKVGPTASNWAQRFPT